MEEEVIQDLHCFLFLKTLETNFVLLWGEMKVVIGPFVFLVLMVHFCKKVNTKQNTNECRKFCRIQQ